jgi:hypothetical protein
MKKMKQWLTGLQDRIDDGINRICYRMSPPVRLLSVLVVGLACTVASLHITITSIYNIGKRDAEKEFLELQHIQSPELQHSKDSINNQLNKKFYEYEQQSNK